MRNIPSFVPAKGRSCDHLPCRDDGRGPVKCRNLYGIPESWNMGLGGLVLDFPSLLYKGLRILMFQLSGVYCRGFRVQVLLLCFTGL